MLFKVSYDAGRFEAAAIEQLLARYRALLQRFLAEPHMTLADFDIKLVAKQPTADSEAQGVVEAVEYAAAGNDTEVQLVALWQQVLETDPIGIHDNFFELGGQSLLATVLVFKNQDAFAIEMGAETAV